MVRALALCFVLTVFAVPMGCDSESTEEAATEPADDKKGPKTKKGKKGEQRSATELEEACLQKDDHGACLSLLGMDTILDDVDKALPLQRHACELNIDSCKNLIKMVWVHPAIEAAQDATRSRLEERCREGESAACAEWASIRLEFDGTSPDEVAPVLADACKDGFGCYLWLTHVVGPDVTPENAEAYSTICEAQLRDACIPLAHAYLTGIVPTEDPVTSAEASLANLRNNPHAKMIRWSLAARVDGEPHTQISSRDKQLGFGPCLHGKGNTTVAACVVVADFLEATHSEAHIEELFTFRARACELGDADACAWTASETEETVTAFFKVWNKDGLRKFAKDYPNSVYANLRGDALAALLAGLQAPDQMGPFWKAVSTAGAVEIRFHPTTHESWEGLGEARTQIDVQEFDVYQLFWRKALADSLARTIGTILPGVQATHSRSRPGDPATRPVLEIRAEPVHPIKSYTLTRGWNGATPDPFSLATFRFEFVLSAPDVAPQAIAMTLAKFPQSQTFYGEFDTLPTTIELIDGPMKTVHIAAAAYFGGRLFKRDAAPLKAFFPPDMSKEMIADWGELQYDIAEVMPTEAGTDPGTDPPIDADVSGGDTTAETVETTDSTDTAPPAAPVVDKAQVAAFCDEWKTDAEKWASVDCGALGKRLARRWRTHKEITGAFEADTTLLDLPECKRALRATAQCRDTPSVQAVLPTRP